jgi:hypothetical protein
MPELLQPVPPIDPVAPVPSILTTARRMSNSIIWKSGITWRPRQKAGTFGTKFLNGSITICDDSDTVALDDLSNEDNNFALPYLARLPFFCEDVLPGFMDEYREDATKILEAATAYAVDVALSVSSAFTDAGDVSATGPVHPLTAMSILLANYSGCTAFGGAVIHVPPVFLAFMMAQGAVKQIGDVYMGPMGCMVAPLQAEGFWATGGGGAVTGTMYVTGPVEYDTGPITIPLTNQQARWDRRENGFYIEAQRLVIARADDVCTFKCNAFLPSPAQGE